MTASFQLVDTESRDDLRVYLERLLRVGEPEVRLLSRGSALAVFGCTQAPMGLGDPRPVVLVMRGFAMSGDADPPINTTVSARAILDRLARRVEVEASVPAQNTPAVNRPIELPVAALSGAWAGVMPPSGGWQKLDAWPADSADQFAAVQSAAEAMGFTRQTSVVSYSQTRTWLRLTTQQGNVLLRR